MLDPMGAFFLWSLFKRSSSQICRQRGNFRFGACDVEISVRVDWSSWVGFCPLTKNRIGNNVSNTSTKETAVITTTLGDIVVEFWPDAAPKTVENFKNLTNKGFFDGTAFHRIVKGFMIQGGDPLSKTDNPSVGTGGPGYTIPAEFNDRPHVRGVLSMARSEDPDSAGSQFFICLADAGFLDRKYTAFGQMIQGDEVLEAIGDTPTVAGNGGEKSKPVTRVGVESIKIVTPSSD